MNKRGVFFLIDSLIAVTIIIVAVVIVLQFSQEPQENLNFELEIADSFMNSLSSTQLQDLEDPFVRKLIVSNISEPDTKAMIAVADLYRRNLSGELSLGYAQNLTQALTKILGEQKQYGFYYKINNTYILNKSFDKLQESKKRVTLSRITFFDYDDAGKQKIFGPVKTEVSIWVT